MSAHSKVVNIVDVSKYIVERKIPSMKKNHNSADDVDGFIQFEKLASNTIYEEESQY